MNKNNDRIDWVDIAKGIAIFLMVCGHTSVPQPINKFIYSFHMPLFLLSLECFLILLNITFWVYILRKWLKVCWFHIFPLLLLLSYLA